MLCVGTLQVLPQVIFITAYEVDIYILHFTIKGWALESGRSLLQITPNTNDFDLISWSTFLTFLLPCLALYCPKPILYYVTITWSEALGQTFLENPTNLCFLLEKKSYFCTYTDSLFIA